MYYHESGARKPEKASSIQVEFTMDMDDVEASERFEAQKIKEGQPLWLKLSEWFGYLWGSIVILLYVGGFIFAPELRMEIGILMLFTILLILVAVVYGKQKKRAAIAEAQAAGQLAIRVTLDDQGIEIKLKDSVTKYEWQAVDEISHIDSHVFLSCNSHLCVIPVRAFDSPEQIEDFIQTGHRHQQASSLTSN